MRNNKDLEPDGDIYRFDIDDQSDAVLQQHVLSDTRHCLFHQHQVGTDVNNALHVVLQKLPLL